MTLIELLVAIALITIAGLATTKATVTARQLFKRSLRESYAVQLATDKMEGLAATDPGSLEAGSQTESLTEGGVAFIRTVTITLNADESRTAVVSVNPQTAGVGGACTLSNTFARAPS